MGALSSASPSLYAFVNQSPLNSVDALGLFSIPDGIGWVLDHTACLASTALPCGGCCGVRQTTTFPVDKIGGGPASLEVKFEWRTQAKKCKICCPGWDGGSGEKVSVTSELRGTMELKLEIPTSLPTIVVRIFGGGSIGGRMRLNANTCTGERSFTGCKTLTARFGVEGCSTLRFAEVCLRGEFNWQKRTCYNPDYDQECVGGRLLARFKFGSRSYDWVIYQSDCID